MITQVLALGVAICEGTPGSCKFAGSLAESQEKTADLNRRPVSPRRPPAGLLSSPGLYPTTRAHRVKVYGVCSRHASHHEPEPGKHQSAQPDHSFWKFPSTLPHSSSLPPSRISGTVGLPSQERQVWLRTRPGFKSWLQCP